MSGVLEVNLDSLTVLLMHWVPTTVSTVKMLELLVYQFLVCTKTRVQLIYKDGIIMIMGLVNYNYAIQISNNLNLLLFTYSL